MYRLSFYHAQTNKNTIFKYLRKARNPFHLGKEQFSIASCTKKKETKKERKYANFQQIKITNNAIT